VKPAVDLTVVGFSGPDGSGKSSLVEAVAEAAAGRGVPVHTVYLYGCVVCRNVRLDGSLRTFHASPGTAALEYPDAPRGVRTSWHRVHAAVDTAELALRLRLACRRARRTARRTGHGVLLLTDRTPLDTVVKHDPPEGGFPTRWLRALGRRYASITLLDARSDVLAARDGEHGVAGLERAQDGYRQWAGRMPGVRTLCTQQAPPEGLARKVLDHVLAGDAGSAAPGPGTPGPSTRSGPARRVLLVTSHPVDGRDGADTEIAIGLAENLPEVAFTYFGRLGRQPAVPGRMVPLASWTGWPGLLEGAQVATWVPMLARSVDLVHAVMTIGPRYAAWSNSRFAPRGRPTIITVPGIVSPECLLGVRPLGVTVALSEATADMLRRAGHPDVRVIPPGIDLTRWPSRPRRPKPRPVLFFAGHTDPCGGTREAIEVAARVQRAGLPVRLVLGLRVRPGQSEFQELGEARSAARRAGLDEVEVHGHVPHMRSAVADADVVLFTPGRLAGGKADIPFVVLEAVATGRPAVVTRLPQMDGLTGIVEQVPVGALDDAAAAVHRLLSLPALWDARAQAGRAAVEQRFGAARMCVSYAQLYEELLAGSTLSRAR
jgi:glycosyltransferase involved in cell wall biosynthesis